MAGPAFFDCHAHTADLSECCSKGIGVDTFVEAVRTLPQLAGVAITNHGFSTYLPADICWSGDFITDPSLFDTHRQWGNRRLEQHLQQVEACASDALRTGMEVELMQDGRLTVDPSFRARLDVLIGSVHFLPHLDPERMTAVVLGRSWRQHTERLMRTGIDILGHPFRWLVLQAGLPVTPARLDAVLSAALETGVALEINAHKCVPGDLEMLRGCARRGVPVAFGTDTHRPHEIGCFDYHLGLLRDAGLTVDQLTLWRPRARPADVHVRGPALPAADAPSHASSRKGP